MGEVAAGRNAHGITFYVWLNEIPTAPALLAIVWLVIA
jgi:uncharacterized membrane protein